MKYWIFSLLFLTLTGCSSSWEPSSSVTTERSFTKVTALSAKAPSDGALIYLYRKSAFAGSLTAWPVQLGNEVLGSLKNGSFILIKVNSGVQNIFPEEPIVAPFATGEKGLSFEAKAGQSYYFRHGRNKMHTSKLKFMPVNSLLAKNEISSYKLVSIIDKYKKNSVTNSGGINSNGDSPKESTGINSTEKTEPKESTETPTKKEKVPNIIENTISEPEGDEKPKLLIVNKTGQTICHNGIGGCSKEKERLLDVPWKPSGFMDVKDHKMNTLQIDAGGHYKTSSTGWTRLHNIKFCQIRTFKHKEGTVKWTIYSLEGGVQQGCSLRGYQQPNWNPKK